MRKGTKTKRERQRAAALRLSEREARSTKEQINHLDNLLGKGVGAKIERARLSESNK